MMSTGTVIYLNDDPTSFSPPYSGKTEAYIGGEWTPTDIKGNPVIGISATAQLLGTSALAIAGIMAKESDTRN